MEERKSMGGAIVDVFDAGVTLVKSEINALIARVTAIIKAKGIGVVLLLAATGPLILGLIFLILFAFYGLIRLGLGAWAAALLIALVSFVIAGVMIWLGIRKLGAEVQTDEPRAMNSGPMTEDERLEAQYQAEQAEKAARERRAASGSAPIKGSVPTSTLVVSPDLVSSGAVSSGAAPRAKVPLASGPRAAAPSGPQTVRQPAPPADEKPLDATHNAGRVDPSRDNTSGPGGSARPSVEVPRDPGLYAGGENRYVSEDGQQATVRVEGGTTTVPVYESEPDGSARMYGDSLNEKLDKGEVAAANRAEPGVRTEAPRDPRLQDPVVLDDAPGISVSTEPTYKDDIKKGGGEV